jgi:DNA-binding PadR family transcriptional regulator
MERGVLRYLILDALTDGPKHGYEVIKRLEERTQGQYTPSPGTVYPTLQLLEDQGLVQAASAEGRKVYALTDAGRADLAAHAEMVAATFGRFTGQAPPTSDSHEAAFLRDELHHLTRTVGVGLQLAGAANDTATLRRIRQAVERCKEEVRMVIAGNDSPATPPSTTASDPGDPAAR